MYAVIKAAGKQYKVSEGSIVKLPLLEGEVGSTIDFDYVLHMGGDNPVAGNPSVPNASVSATIVRHGRERKLLVYKFKRRKGFEKLRGHRTHFTEVKINTIASGKSND